jgi:hypothetical protein
MRDVAHRANTIAAARTGEGTMSRTVAEARESSLTRIAVDGARHAGRAVSNPSAVRIAMLYGLLFLISQLPLYATEYPDITDFPNHVARFHVLSHLADSNWLRTYYSAAPHSIFPNMAMELAVPLLDRWMDTASAVKVFASLATLAMTTGAMALGRALTGRLSYLGLGVLLFANNAMLQFGLLNYIASLGLALWLLAAWVAAPELRKRTTGIFLFGIGATVVYLSHLSAWGVYAIATIASQARFKARRGKAFSARVEEPAATLLPLLPAVLLHVCLADPPSGSSITTGETSLLAFVVYKVTLFALTPGGAFSGYAAEGGVLGAVTATAVYFGLRHGVLSLADTAGRVGGALALSMALVPPAIFGSALADTRLLVPVVLVLWSGLKIDRKPWDTMIVIPLMVLGLATAAATAFEWHKRDPDYREIRRVLAQLPEGARVATVTLDGDSTYISPHVVGWAVIDRSVFMSNLYSRPFQPVWLAYRPDHVALARRGRTENVSEQERPNYDAVKDYYDYVLVLESSASAIRSVSGAAVLFDADWARLVRTR